jgi:hypothetical protein
MQSLPGAERDTADNVVLLCRNCHGEIDDLLQADLFVVDKVFAIKHEHETFIRDITGRSESHRTVVLRMRGNVRGAPDNLGPRRGNQAILGSTDRFPAFPFAPDRFGIEIDLRDVPGKADANPAYYQAAAAESTKLSSGSSSQPPTLTPCPISACSPSPDSCCWSISGPASTTPSPLTSTSGTALARPLPSPAMAKPPSSSSDVDGQGVGVIWVVRLRHKGGLSQDADALGTLAAADRGQGILVALADDANLQAAAEHDGAGCRRARSG